MDEVDRLLFQSLGNIGWKGDGERLKDVSTEDLIEAVIMCLWQINPSHRTDIPSTKLPPNMTSKFRITTKITTVIKDLGYRADLGYQTLLYGSEKEIRNVLLFLVEHLPKVSSADQIVSPDDSKEDYLSWVINEGSQKIRNDLLSPWVPYYCRSLRFKWDGKLWHPPKDGSIPFSTTSKTADSNTSNWHHFPPHAVESNQLMMLDQPTSSSRVFSNLDIIRAVDSLLNSSSSRSKPALKPKPSLPNKPNLTKTDTSESDKSPTLKDEENDEANKKESERREILAVLEQERTALLGKVSDVQHQLHAGNKERKKLYEQWKSWENETEHDKEEMNALNRWAAALQNPEYSKKQLQKYLEESEGRMDKVEGQWLDASTRIRDEIGQLRDGIGGQWVAQMNQLTQQIGQLKTKMAGMEEEANEKQTYLQQLEKELGKMEKGINRSAYTKRILEIVSSVRKQREEINKVLDETRVLQKDINMIVGKLDRTFIATDESLFESAKTDESIRRAYIVIASLHEKCAETLKSLETTGQIQREIQDIQDSMEMESQKGTDDSLEKLVNDYCQIKQDNQKLIEQIQAVSNGES